MRVELQAAPLTDIRTPLLAVNLFEGVRTPGGATGAADAACGGLISQLIADGEISGELGQVVVIHTRGRGGLAADRVAVVGLGKSDEFGLEEARAASAAAVCKARELRLTSLATIVHGAGIGGLDPADAAQAVAEGALLASYDYRQHKTQMERPPVDVESLTIVERDTGKLDIMEPAIRLAEKSAAATILARDLSVGPSNLVTPRYLAERAREVADREGLECRVFEKADLERMGMGGILAVGQGSANPPCLVDLRYRAPGGARTLAVVGKGITFDSGGISIKPAENMGAMKHDMSGAAAVLGFCQLAAQAKLPLNVIGIFAPTENLPGGSAYKPGDIYRAYNGKTMEIVNTDAEGRVTLADALSYAAEQRPDAIVDLATLTGACVVALGNYATGVIGTDDRLVELFRRAGEKSGERVWPLPLWPVYEKEIESPVADIKNSAGRPAGAITAAAFLKNFVGEIPWVHLDIAGTAWVDEQCYVPPYQAKSLATGVGVRLLLEFSRLWVS